MLQISSNMKIYVATEFTDMRKGFPGLSGQVKNTLQLDPLSGHLFLFRNRRRNMLKILFWMGDGYAIFFKRLERGTFEFPQSKDGSECLEIRASELAMILDGIRLAGRIRQPRFELPD